MCHCLLICFHLEGKSVINLEEKSRELCLVAVPHHLHPWVGALYLLPLIKPSER